MAPSGHHRSFTGKPVCPNKGAPTAPCTATGSGIFFQRVSKSVARAGKIRQNLANPFKYCLNTTISETMQWFHARRQILDERPMPIGRK